MREEQVAHLKNNYDLCIANHGAVLIGTFFS